MQSNLYIPQKITVGFQKRSDTFTGKLAFVTYTDEKGVLRQEKAWNGWRDQKIKSVEFDNTPRPNFVFNKDVSRNGYWSDVTKVRIYDPRDFEFEIDVSNMMYLLMHSDISKRDIAEECVFAWNGRNLLLIPVNSEEYRNSVENTRKLNSKFSTKDLVLGHTYASKKLGDVVYLGYHEWSEKRYSGGSSSWQSVGKKHIFNINKQYYEKYMSLDGKDLAEVISAEVHPNYAAIVESLFKCSNMKKSGKFSVKKGFDRIGYKRTAYETFKVVINENTNGYDTYKLYTLVCSVHDDIPKLSQIKEYHNWGLRTFENNMRDENINSKNPEQVKKYFAEKGFGEIYYTNTKGEKTKVS